MRAAMAEVRRAETLATMPAVREAAVTGRVTVEHVDVVARIAAGASVPVREALGSDQGQATLVELARRIDAGQFARFVALWADGLDAGAHERDHQAQRAARFLHLADTDGGTRISGQLDRMAGHRLRLALEAASGRPGVDDDRTSEQRRADALGAIAEKVLSLPDTGSGAAVRPHISFVMTERTWAGLRALRGVAAASGEGAAAAAAVPPVTLEDGTPVPISEVAQALCDCELTRVVMGAGSEPLDLGRTQRTYTGAQRRAVIARDGGCAWPSCDRPARWCEVHHIRWWDRDRGATSVQNGVLLCSFHHHEVHRQDLSIRRRPGDDGLAGYVFARPDGRVLAPAGHDSRPPDLGPPGVRPPGVRPPDLRPPGPTGTERPPDVCRPGAPRAPGRQTSGGRSVPVGPGGLRSGVRPPGVRPPDLGPPGPTDVRRSLGARRAGWPEVGWSNAGWSNAGWPEVRRSGVVPGRRQHPAVRPCEDIPRQSVVARAAPDRQVLPVHLVVVEGAQEHPVLHGGRAAVPVPPSDVVHLAPSGRPVAGGPRAPAVPGDDRAPLRSGVGALGAAEVEWLRAGAHHHAGQLAVAQGLGHLADRNRCAVLERHGRHGRGGGGALAGRRCDAAQRTEPGPRPLGHHERDVWAHRSPRSRVRQRQDLLGDRAEGILSLPDTGSGAAVRPHISFVMTERTWAGLRALRGVAAASGEGGAAAAPVPPVTLEDGTPVPISEVARALCDCELTRVVMGAGSEPLDLGRTQRTYTGAQRRAVIARDGGCAWPSCDRPARWCEVHHIRWWDRDRGATSVQNGVLLCSFHHHEVHRQDL